jgi:carbamoyltransferase
LRVVVTRAETPNIIGISAHYHDAACCLLSGKQLVAAAQEERFTRRKHDPSIPMNAFRFCIEAGGLTIDEIDCIAYYEVPSKKLDRQLWMDLPELPTVRPEALFRLDAMRAERDIRDILGFDGRVEFYDHHESHAASAFFFSGYDEAAILTADGVGEWDTLTYGVGSGDDLEVLERVEFPHSLGLLYSAVTSYLGFEVNDAEYKVMGLAPYGEPRYRDEFSELLSYDQSGSLELNLRYFDFRRDDRMFSDDLPALFGHDPREPESEMPSWVMDVARSLQEVVEETLVAKVRYLHTLVPSKNLCMAGGLALNCVANSRILRDGPFERLFVQPAAGDAGGALGAAALARRALGGLRSPERLRSVLLGPVYSRDDVRRTLGSSSEIAEFYARHDDLVEEVAKRLAAGDVVGWFDGPMEFGPRALGARSILADPRPPEMRDRINSLVKKREAFRPFAPAVLGERVSDHFDLDHESLFMLETCQVISPLTLPAITHVDGSARVQTVHLDVTPRFHALLSAFYDLTGCPVLLNTSFNVRGEPIVCSPVDALLCFIRAGLDLLVLGDYVIGRHDLPPAWVEWLGDSVPMPRAEVSESVYTFL